MKLPESVQTKLFAFMDSIPKTPFFKPDCKLKGLVREESLFALSNALMW